MSGDNKSNNSYTYDNFDDGGIDWNAITLPSTESIMSSLPPNYTYNNHNHDSATTSTSLVVDQQHHGTDSNAENSITAAAQISTSRGTDFDLERVSLQEQIQQLQNRLTEKDDVIFGLESTIASIQSETTHQIMETERNAQMQIQNVNDELRKLKVEVDSKHILLMNMKKKRRMSSSKSYSGTDNGNGEDHTNEPVDTSLLSKSTSFLSPNPLAQKAEPILDTTLPQANNTRHNDADLSLRNDDIDSNAVQTHNHPELYNSFTTQTHIQRLASLLLLHYPTYTHPYTHLYKLENDEYTTHNDIHTISQNFKDNYSPTYQNHVYLDDMQIHNLLLSMALPTDGNKISSRINSNDTTKKIIKNDSTSLNHSNTKEPMTSTMSFFLTHFLEIFISKFSHSVNPINHNSVEEQKYSHDDNNNHKEPTIQNEKENIHQDNSFHKGEVVSLHHSFISIITILHDVLQYSTDAKFYLRKWMRQYSIKTLEMKQVPEESKENDENTYKTINGSILQTNLNTVTLVDNTVMNSTHSRIVGLKNKEYQLRIKSAMKNMNDVLYSPLGINSSTSMNIVMQDNDNFHTSNDDDADDHNDNKNDLIAKFVHIISHLILGTFFDNDDKYYKMRTYIQQKSLSILFILLNDASSTNNYSNTNHGDENNIKRNQISDIWFDSLFLFRDSHSQNNINHLTDLISLLEEEQHTIPKSTEPLYRQFHLRKQISSNHEKQTQVHSSSNISLVSNGDKSEEDKNQELLGSNISRGKKSGEKKNVKKKSDPKGHGSTYISKNITRASIIQLVALFIQSSSYVRNKIYAPLNEDRLRERYRDNVTLSIRLVAALSDGLQFDILLYLQNRIASDSEREEYDVTLNSVLTLGGNVSRLLNIICASSTEGFNLVRTEMLVKGKRELTDDTEYENLQNLSSHSAFALMVDLFEYSCRAVQRNMYNIKVEDEKRLSSKWMVIVRNTLSFFQSIQNHVLRNNASIEIEGKSDKDALSFVDMLLGTNRYYQFNMYCNMLVQKRPGERFDPVDEGVKQHARILMSIIEADA